MPGSEGPGAAEEATPAGTDVPHAEGGIRGGPIRGVYYGWILVAVLGVTETTSWGILYYSFTVFLAPMGAELGWSRAAMTGAFSLALLLSGIAAVPVGQWLDRFGPRLIMTIGSCVGVGLVLAWSRVEDLVAFYVVWAAIGVTMATVLYDPAFAVVAVWFRRRRSQALTALTLMAGLASTIFIPLAAWLVQAQGWRTALVTMAVLLAVITIVPHAAFLRRHPRDLGLDPDGVPIAESAETADAAPPERSVSPKEALRHPSFRWLAIAFCLYMLPSTGIPVHFVAYLSERGYDLPFAAAATGAIGGLQVVGRIFFAPLERRLPPRAVSAGIFALQPIALAILLLVPSTAGVIAFVVLFGASRGVATLLRSILVVGLYGPARYASIAGILAFFITASQAAAPVTIGAAYDAAGGYGPVLGALLVASIASAFAIFQADRRKRA